MKSFYVLAVLLAAQNATALRHMKSSFTTADVCPAITMPPIPRPRKQCKGYGVIREFPVEHVLPSNLPEGETPPVEIGTKANMCLHPKIDWGGIWWMSSHHNMTWDGKQANNALDEYLISFAGAVVNSTSSFPVKLTSPTAHAGHWTWGASEAGKFLMNYYAQTSNASEHQQIVFINETFAKFSPVADALSADGRQYLAMKQGPDEWVRANLNPESETPDKLQYIYTLVRIVREDGSPTKFWDMFLDYMHNSSNFVSPFWAKSHMITWGSNDDCMRKCEIGYLTRLAPCWSCAVKCGLFR